MTDASMNKGTMRRLKRSRVLHVSSLMATAGFTLAACGSPAPSAPAAPEGDWDVPSQVAYTSVDACVTAGEPQDQCESAYNEARKTAADNAQRYGTKEDCETTWGPGQCEQGTNSAGGSFFMPMLAGFMMARMLNNGQRAAPQPLYRDCRVRNPDGTCKQTGLRSGTAGYWGRGGNPNEQARDNSSRSKSTVSRGGFGGSRGYYGG